MSNFLTDLIPWKEFIEDQPGQCLVRLRAGGTMAGFEISGPCAEGTSDAELEAKAKLVANSIRHFGTGDMIHTIYHRVTASEYPQREFPTLAARMIDDERARQFQKGKYYRNLLRWYISNQDESAVTNQLKAMLFASTAHRAAESQELQRQRFLHRLRSWEDAVARTIHPNRMGAGKTFRDLVLCTTTRDFPAIEPAGRVPLHHAIAQQDLLGGNEPEIGELHLRPISITTYPTETVPQMLAVLLRQPGRLMLSVRFICLDPIDAQQQLRLERAHWVRESQGSLMDILAKVLGMPRRKTLNQNIEAQIADVDEAIAAAASGMPFGFCTITCTVIDEEPKVAYSRQRQMIKDLNAIGVDGRIEDANAAAAILGSWPGNGWDNVRRPLVAASTFAEMVLPVDFFAGTPTIDSNFYPKETPVPLIVTGTGHSPFAVPTHRKGVGHQLLLGMTGDGKSTLLGTMVSAATTLPDVRIVWLDRDYSSWVLTHALDGTYIELATDNSSPLCPFQFLELPNGLAFLFDWFSRLFNRWGFELDERQAADLTEALDIAKASGIRHMRGFIFLIHDERMRVVLMNYGGGGKWSHIFDGEPTDHNNMLVTYEMRELDSLGDRAASPAKELIISGVEAGLGKRHTFVFLDEAWHLLRDKVSQDWLYRGFREFRRRDGALILATQSLVELANSDYCELILESCSGGTIYLPNPQLNGDYVRAAYRKLGLSETELDTIQNAEPQRQYLWKSSAGIRLFDLDLGPIARALCASTGAPAVAAAREVLKRVGQSQFVNEWLRTQGALPNGNGATKWIPNSNGQHAALHNGN
jgi:type IV secretion system protein VirB4